MILDLSHLSVEQDFGAFCEVDARKDVANAIHRGTSDIGVDDFARKLYYSVGTVDVPAHMAREISNVVAHSALVAYVKRAVLDALQGKEVADR